MKVIYEAALFTTGLAIAGSIPGYAQQLQFVSQQPFSAQNRYVVPFGYGAVSQILTTASGVTGDMACKASVSNSSQCISVSGAQVCSAALNPNTLVSCNVGGKANVDESRFNPVPCGIDANDNINLSGDGGVSGEITDSDWCGWTGYMAHRTTDTLYQYDDYVRLGINKRFGGMVFELYGVDKLDRIQQHPGAGLQLALYGDASITDAPAGTPTGWFASLPPSQTRNWLPPTSLGWNNIAYLTQNACTTANPNSQACNHELNIDNVSDDVTEVGCANNGQDAGTGFNPVQGVSLNCWYGDPNNAVDSVASVGDSIKISKYAPNNYSKSTNVPGLTWTQSSRVVGPFAELSYDIVGDSRLRKMTADFQELPAIFLHRGMGGSVYYYGGSNPYASINEPVTLGILNEDPADGKTPDPGKSTTTLGYPNRTGPFDTGTTNYMTEDWVSMCDTTGVQCVTTASFSNDAQLIQASNVATGSYVGVHGFFTLQPGLKKDVSLFITPYRFDDVVEGKSIRQWIYDLKNNPALEDTTALIPTGTKVASGKFQLAVGQTKNIGNLVLAMQYDGNFVAYTNDAQGLKGNYVWASSTSVSVNSSNCHKTCQAIFQTDGNLVLYNDSGKPYWASNTSSEPNAQFIVNTSTPYLEIINQGRIAWSSSGTNALTAAK